MSRATARVLERRSWTSKVPGELTACLALSVLCTAASLLIAPMAVLRFEAYGFRALGISTWFVGGVLGVVFSVSLWRSSETTTRGLLLVPSILFLAASALAGQAPTVEDPLALFEQVAATRKAELTLACSAIAVGSLMAVSEWGSVRKSAATEAVAHGSAAFAQEEELRELGLLGAPEGRVPLGTWDGHLLRLPLESHLLCTLPSGYGKTTWFTRVVLEFDGPVLVVDPKGQILEAVGGYRASLGRRVVDFRPEEGAETFLWNPFDEISPDVMVAERDVWAIVTMLLPPEQGGSGAHFVPRARTMLWAVIMHLKLTEPGANFSMVLKMLGDAEAAADAEGNGICALFEHFARLEQDPERTHGWVDEFGEPTGRHRTVSLAFSSFSLPGSDREVSSVAATVNKCLAPWMLTSVAEATDRSTWSTSELLDGTADVFITVTVSGFEAVAPVVRMLLAALLRKAERRGTSAPDGSSGVLLVLDELAQLGQMELFTRFLSFGRGFGFVVLAATQELQQIGRVYGKDHELVSLFHYLLCGASGSTDSAEEISKRLGNATVHYGTRGRSGSVFMPVSNASLTSHLGARALLNPSEVMGLDRSGGVLMGTGQAPVPIRTIPFYKDPVSLERVARGQAPRVPEQVPDRVPALGTWRGVMASGSEGLRAMYIDREYEKALAKMKLPPRKAEEVQS